MSTDKGVVTLVLAIMVVLGLVALPGILTILANAENETAGIPAALAAGIGRFRWVIASGFTLLLGGILVVAWSR